MTSKPRSLSPAPQSTDSSCLWPLPHCTLFYVFMCFSGFFLEGQNSALFISACEWRLGKCQMMTEGRGQGFHRREAGAQAEAPCWVKWAEYPVRRVAGPVGLGSIDSGRGWRGELRGPGPCSCLGTSGLAGGDSRPTQDTREPLKRRLPGLGWGWPRRCQAQLCSQKGGAFGGK